jgi:1-acyl-sn-glycerol-3-phosphate acyltransferase
MLEFTDSPYVFVPPKPSRLILGFVRWYNRFFYMPRIKMMRRVIVTNPDILQPVRAANCNRILFLPNHSTHCDPEIMMESQRQLGIVSTFMAAYDVFQRSRRDAWMIQHCGVFSIDRDGSDRQALKTAIDILATGKYALTVFPEGNVNFTNDRVQSFLEGAAFIALKAARECEGQGEIYAVPVAIKVTHTTDARKMLYDRLSQMAIQADTTCDRAADLQVELRRIGIVILRQALTAHRYAVPAGDVDDLGVFLQTVVGTIVEDLEQDMERQPRTRDTLDDRVRAIRRVVHEMLIDEEQVDKHTVAQGWSDRVMLAFRALSYSGDYVAESPTVDRVGETIEKLLEDQVSLMPPAYAERHAYVRLCEPVPLSTYLEAFKTRTRGALQELTEHTEAAVQSGLDVLNTELETPGAQPF